MGNDDGINLMQIRRYDYVKIYKYAGVCTHTEPNTCANVDL